MRGGLFARVIASATVCVLAACGGEPDDGQRLVATGTLLADDGTPLPGQTVDRYELTFSLVGEAGDVSITRTFTDDGTGEQIVADENGRFQLSTLDLALSYDWARDEYVCDDVCVAWDAVCYEVTEEVCLDTCSEDQCFEDCYDDCSLDCYDEVVCDEFGDCWTETVCDEFCVPVCDTVCETVAYPCNCYWDTYDVCEDQCVETVEECGWVTRTYTSFPALEEIVDTSARISVDGTSITGNTIEAFQHAMCNETCRTVNLWVQNDRFLMPAP